MRKGLQQVFVREGEPYASLVQAVAGHLRARLLVPLFGAGLSVDPPSRLALADDLLRPLSDELWRSLALAVDEIRPPPSEQDLQIAKGVLHAARLERVLDVLHRAHGCPAMTYLGVLNSRCWNSNHAAIAAITRNGFLPWCITLNFDLLLEEAVAAAGAACSTECPLTNQSFEYGKGPAVLRIAKPHGSFAPEHASSDPYSFLSATLSQVGSQPATPNVDIFRRILSRCPVVLVAGYSDNDWDVFPILARLQPLLKRIIWVQHASDEDVANRRLPTGGLEGSDPLRNRVVPLLKRCGPESVLLVGPLKHFLSDLLDELGVQALPPPVCEKQPDPPDPTPFVASGGPSDPVAIKTVLSLAMLIQQTGVLSESLPVWLRNQPLVRATPRLAWQVEDIIGHTEHTRSNLESAITHTRQVIRLKQAAKQPVGCDTVWLGYEYLCLAKRPNPLKPWRVLGIPFAILRGLRLLKRGVGAGEDTERQRLSALATYYRADLLHSWGNYLLLLGDGAVRLLRSFFRSVVRQYDRIASNSDLMNGEYYWLRYLEAQLLAGATLDRMQIEERLDEIERAYQLTQNNVQVGNTCAYRALVVFLLDKKPKKQRRREAAQHLDMAERTWDTAGKDIMAGRRRVVLFRRFIGEISLWNALTVFLGKSQAPL